MQPQLADTFRVLDYLPIGAFAINRNYTVIYWNRGLELWSGIQAADIVGANLLYVFPHLNHPMYLVRINEIFGGGPPAIFSAQLHNYIIPAHLRNGVTRTQQTTVSGLLDPASGNYLALFAIQDVTDLTIKIREQAKTQTRLNQELQERSRIEAELLHQSELLHGVLESMTARIAVLDHDGVIISLNDSGRRILSPREGIAALRVGDNYLDHFQDQFEAASEPQSDVYTGVSEVLAGRLAHFETEYQIASGDHEQWFILSVTPLAAGRRGAVVSHVDITRQKLAERQIEFMAMHDNLTGLPNRKLFRDRLTVALTKARRYVTPLAIIYLDLDGFKPVNDTYGHETGDQLLRQVAERLISGLRACDTVARMGGDEFAILLTDIRQESDARNVADKLLDSLNRPFDIGGRDITISASFGLSFDPYGNSTPDVLISRADTAMYQAKRQGRGRCESFDRPAD